MNLEKVWPWLKRGLAGLVLLFLVGMVMDFNGRMAELTRLQAQHAQESNQIANLEATQYILQTQIAYATSQPAVEEWAREEGKLAQDGDFVVALIPDANYTPAPTPIPELAVDRLSTWETWYAWFFGHTP
jgi:cell division protein FtsB